MQGVTTKLQADYVELGNQYVDSIPLVADELPKIQSGEKCRRLIQEHFDREVRVILASPLTRPIPLTSVALQDVILQHPDPLQRLRDIAQTLPFQLVCSSLCSPQIEERIRQVRTEIRSHVLPSILKIQCLSSKLSELGLTQAHVAAQSYALPKCSRSLLWVENPFVVGSAGFYKKQRVLGSGTYKVVRLIEPLFPTALLPPFALAKSKKDPHDSEVPAGSLEPECSMSQRLEELHVPYVIKSRRVLYEKEGEFFFSFRMVSEYCSYGTLRDFVRNEGNKSLFIRLPLVLEVIAALKRMHQHNIAHVDLKVDNIFVTVGAEDFEIRIGDLGSVRTVRADPVSSEIRPLICTYPSPEVILQSRQGAISPVTKEIDLWNLGDILYFLRYGVSLLETWHLNTKNPLILDRFCDFSRFVQSELLVSPDVLERLIGALFSVKPSERPSEIAVEVAVCRWLDEHSKKSCCLNFVEALEKFFCCGPVA